jgi:hypothetical protein
MQVPSRARREHSIRKGKSNTCFGRLKLIFITSKAFLGIRIGSEVHLYNLKAHWLANIQCKELARLLLATRLFQLDDDAITDALFCSYPITSYVARVFTCHLPWDEIVSGENNAPKAYYSPMHSSPTSVPGPFS